MRKVIGITGSIGTGKTTVANKFMELGYKSIDCDKINRMFTLRHRRAGDKIFMGGMHKSVKKLMCDKKIPTELRSRIPMICDGDRIVAIPFVGVCDEAKPKKDATNNLLIQFYLY